jgi:hypothetical protein
MLVDVEIINTTGRKRQEFFPACESVCQICQVSEEKFTDRL